MVKSRSKVMGDFTCQNSEPQGNFMIIQKFCDFFSSLAILIANDRFPFIKIDIKNHGRSRSEERSNFTFEIFDVLIGPL